MTEADADRFATLMEGMAETFGATLSPGQLLGYSMGLADLAVEDIETAVGRAMRTLKFMPKPAELRELAGVLTPASRAIVAWGAVKRAVHSLSAYGSPDFDDPIVNATVRNMGGWVRLCGSDAATFETFTRKDFERIYTHLYQAGGHLGDTGGYLPGINGDPPKRVLTGLPVERRSLPAVARPQTNGKRAASEQPASAGAILAAMLPVRQ